MFAKFSQALRGARILKEQFRYIAFLTFQERLSERQTIENFMDVIAPAMEEVAEAFGFKVSFGDPEIVIRDAHQCTNEMYGTRYRQNLNIMSKTNISVTFKSKVDDKVALKGQISVTNTFSHSEIIYAADSYIVRGFEVGGGEGLSMPFRVPFCLDYNLSRPGFRAAHIGNAKMVTANFIAFANIQTIFRAHERGNFAVAKMKRKYGCGE